MLCSNSIFENVNFLFFVCFLLSQYSFSFPQFKETFQSTHKHGDIPKQFCLINKHIKFFSYFLVWVALHMATISQIQVLIFYSLEIYVLRSLINIGMLYFDTFIHFPICFNIWFSQGTEGGVLKILWKPNSFINIQKWSNNNFSIKKAIFHFQNFHHYLSSILP